jgi:hypothetical protein
MAQTEIHMLVLERRITRLCHFTPSRNLMHIAAEGKGLLATAHLKDDERLIYNATDLERLDGHPNHMCCSIQYPNAYYFKKAREDDPIFKDWVVLLLAPHYLWEDGTLFCARNAAAGYGRFIRAGIEGFKALYASSVPGAGGQEFRRSSTHPASCPTDNQAEVLVADGILPSDILAVAVQSSEQAQTEFVRLNHLGVTNWNVPFVVAPDFYQPQRLTRLISSGVLPPENTWLPGRDG